MSDPSGSSTTARHRARAELAIAVLTRNRWAMVDRCLTSIYHQAAAHGVPIHVLVNGSDDDTAERIARTYPDVDLHVTDANLGVGPGRNHLMEQIDATWVLHLDDDGTVGSRFVEDALVEIRQAPPDRVVVAGHIIDVDVDPDPVRVTGPGYRFSGGICILQAAAFSRLGGYLSAGYRQGEEDDYTIRLHHADLAIWQVAELVLFHPLVRDRAQQVEVLRTGLTQSVVTSVRYAPWWAVVPWVMWKLLSHLRLAIRLRAPAAYASGVFAGLRLIPSTLQQRTPVRLDTMLASSGRFNARLDVAKRSTGLSAATKTT